MKALLATEGTLVAQRNLKFTLTIPSKEEEKPT